jgi:aryl-alcohol dehydrogenase-like predicted oxidoreductase
VDRFEKLSKKKALKVFNVLVNLKKKKQISKFGFAIYSFKNLKKICKDFKPDILQCPYNVFDRRLDEKELLKYLSSNKIEIHVRSIFLQGLLLADYSKLPKKFLKWKSVFKKFYDWVLHNKISNLSACYNFIKNNKYIDKILIGVDNYSQLKEIIRVRGNRNIKFPDIFVKDEKLINPSKW